MNLLLKFGPYGEMLTVAPEHTAALLALVPHLRRVNSSGYGEAQTFTMEPLPPEAMFVAADKLEPLNPRELALKEALEKKDAAWVSAFTERDNQKARVKELEREVERLLAREEPLA